MSETLGFDIRHRQMGQYTCHGDTQSVMSSVLGAQLWSSDPGLRHVSALGARNSQLVPLQGSTSYVTLVDVTRTTVAASP